MSTLFSMNKSMQNKIDNVKVSFYVQNFVKFVGFVSSPTKTIRRNIIYRKQYKLILIIFMFLNYGYINCDKCNDCDNDVGRGGV